MLSITLKYENYVSLIFFHSVMVITNSSFIWSYAAKKWQSKFYQYPSGIQELYINGVSITAH